MVNKLLFGYVMFGIGIIGQIVSLLGTWPKYALFVSILIFSVGCVLLSGRTE